MSSSAVNLQTWDRVKADLGSSLPTDIYDMCFRAVTCRKVEGECITLGAPNDFAAIWINDNYLDLITQKMRHATGRQLKVVIESDGRSDAAAAEKQLDGNAGAAAVATTVAKAKAAPARRPKVADDRAVIPSALNPRNTFENFVVGPNSQLAHATALAVAQSPSRAYNPL